MQLQQQAAKVADAAAAKVVETSAAAQTEEPVVAARVAEEKEAAACTERECSKCLPQLLQSGRLCTAAQIRERLKKNIIYINESQLRITLSPMQHSRGKLPQHWRTVDVNYSLSEQALTHFSSLDITELSEAAGWCAAACCSPRRVSGGFCGFSVVVIHLSRTLRSKSFSSLRESPHLPTCEPINPR